MQLSSQQFDSGCWCKIKMHVIEGVVALKGILKETRDGEVVNLYHNTATANFKKKTAQGAATGSFNAINKARLNWSGGSATVTPTKIAGGDGAHDYVTYSFEWKNETGASKTLTSLDIGYDLGGGGEVIYCQKTGLSKEVADDETVKYTWTITCAYSSGGVTQAYRQQLAYMIYGGSFSTPNKIDFYSTVGSNYETATLEDGGDGVETYHQWIATYIAPAGGQTIDIIYFGYYSGGMTTYSEHDITNKALDENDELEAHVKITHG